MNHFCTLWNKFLSLFFFYDISNSTSTVRPSSLAKKVKDQKDKHRLVLFKSLYTDFAVK